MVLCLVTLTDHQTRRAGLSASAELLVWPSYCQISTDVDKILHTPIVVRNTLMGRLRPRSACGRLQAKPKQLYFYCATQYIYA